MLVFHFDFTLDCMWFNLISIPHYIPCRFISSEAFKTEHISLSSFFSLNSSVVERNSIALESIFEVVAIYVNSKEL